MAIGSNCRNRIQVYEIKEKGERNNKMMIPIQFYRLKCRICGSKFTLNTSYSCSECKFFGIPCYHKTLCFRCYKDAMLQDNLFFSTAIAIVLVATYALGGRIL